MLVYYIFGGDHGGGGLKTPKYKFLLALGGEG